MIPFQRLRGEANHVAAVDVMESKPTAASALAALLPLNQVAGIPNPRTDAVWRVKACIEGQSASVCSPHVGSLSGGPKKARPPPWFERAGWYSVEYDSVVAPMVNSRR